MNKILVAICLLLSSCTYYSNENHTKREAPLPGELKYQIGDCLYFKTTDSTYGCVIVCDFSKDEGGVWYGVFYTGYDSVAVPSVLSIIKGKVMGRKVHSALDAKGYQTCLDGDFINERLFTNTNSFTLFGNVRLNGNVHLGKHGAAKDIGKVQRSFLYGKEYRLKPPDHYTEHLTKLDNFHPEEYFELKDFIQ